METPHILLVVVALTDALVAAETAARIFLHASHRLTDEVLPAETWSARGLQPTGERLTAHTRRSVHTLWIAVVAATILSEVTVPIAPFHHTIAGIIRFHSQCFAIALSGRFVPALLAGLRADPVLAPSDAAVLQQGLAALRVRVDDLGGLVNPAERASSKRDVKGYANAGSMSTDAPGMHDSLTVGHFDPICRCSTQPNLLRIGTGAHHCGGGGKMWPAMAHPIIRTIRIIQGPCMAELGR